MPDSNHLHLYKAGDPQGPAVLFLHGSPLSGRMWLPNFDSLRDFHCLAPDLPGHGLSRDTVGWPMDRLADHLAEIIRDHATNKRAHIVGLSYGGVVAQALISRHPEVVDKAILSGTSAPLSRLMKSVFKLYVGLNRPLVKLLPASALGWLLSLQFGIPKPHLADLAEDMKQMDADVMMETLLSSYLDIRAPIHTDKEILVIAGGKETPFAKSMARQLTRIIPGARGMIIPGVGHVWNLQDPQLFAQVLRWWFGGKAIDGQFFPCRVSPRVWRAGACPHSNPTPDPTAD